MKFILIGLAILLTLFIGFQIYITVSTNNTEAQPYEVVKTNKQFEIRYYPSATIAKITSIAKSYSELGSTGFKKLAGYIFGGNSENKQIAMTSPVHMDMNDSNSSMGFVMPSSYTKENLPNPNNKEISIETTEPEYVAAITFGGFANSESIDENKKILKKLLDENGFKTYGNFRFLGYNPPYQIFGRKNEVIVSVIYNEK